MSKWRRRLHRRHSRSYAWQTRQHAIEMRGAPTIKVKSIGEALEIVGQVLRTKSENLTLRRLGSLLTASGRNDYAMKLGMDLARKANGS